MIAPLLSPTPSLELTGQAYLPFFFAIAGYQALWRVRAPLNMAGFCGSAWRGSLGRALYDFSCGHCGPSSYDRFDSGQNSGGCCYRRFFEPRGKGLPSYGEGQVHRSSSLVWRPPEPGPARWLEPHSILRMPFVAIGRVSQRIKLWQPVWRRMGEAGIGRGQAPLTWLGLERCSLLRRRLGPLHGGISNPLKPLGDQPELALWRIPPRPPSLRLILETPLRLLGPKKQLLTTNNLKLLSGQILAEYLLRRLWALAQDHGIVDAHWEDKHWQQAAKEIHIVNHQLRWYKLARRSGSQQRTISISGYLGWLELAGDGLDTYWPAFWIGQFVNFGKGTSQGLGRFRIQVLDDEQGGCP